MNVYVVVEGVGERKVYEHWIPLVNPNLGCVQHIADIEHNHFAVLTGGGYPQYFEVIDAAIADVNHYRSVDRLVIAVDSEEMTLEEKLAEVEEHISQSPCAAEVVTVVQHFCLETWALGNILIVRRHPQSRKLREYKLFFDVRIADPELLPPYEVEGLNRAQFAAKYLCKALNDKYSSLSYRKSNPQALLNDRYFERVKQRLEETGHIASLGLSYLPLRSGYVR